jgi:mono/diheme cytochrome c family protein
MRRRRVVLGGLLAVAAVAAVAAVVAIALVALNRGDPAAGAGPVLAGAAPAGDALTRGRYLATAADCVACHTVPGSQADFAGGVAFKLPFGTIYSTNITPDPDDGIGRWSDDEFVRAVREGVNRDGRHLYPAFPYTAYTRLSRADVLAIKAYLFSLAPSTRRNKRNALSFPFNQRWAIYFWNAAFFQNKRFVADTSRTPSWNRGAYLATALGHCGECHTPRNLAFGVEHGREFAGASLQGWRAYNITADPRYGIGAWSVAELTAYLRTGHASGHATAGGPMAEAVAHSLQYLHPDDTAALVEYLRTVAAREGADPIAINPAPAAALAASDAAPGKSMAHAEGRKLFEGACASCHQYDGQGQQTPYASLLGTRGVNDPDGMNVTQAILQGVDARIAGEYIFMPSFGSAYSDTEVSELADFLIEQFGGKQGRVTPQDVGRRRSL